MTTSTIKVLPACATDVIVTDDALSVALSDGRQISVPLSWYPRLQAATAAERRAWRLLDGGRAIRWNAVDEDISIAGILAGRPSRENPAALARWRAARRA